MKKIWKRALAILLAVLLTGGAAPLGALADILPVAAAAESDNSYSELDWYVDDYYDGVGLGAGVYIAGCAEDVTELVIPDTIEGYPVVRIDPGAFAGRSGLMSVTIGNNVTSIGENAFYNCSGLTSVTIGNSVTSIGNTAFSSCSGLTSVTIPDSVTSIGDGAFIACWNLADIAVDADNSAYSTDENGVLYNKDKTTLILYPCGSARTAFTIPDSVTCIGKAAFAISRNLTDITIPDGVTDIGEHAFYACFGLTSVTIPDGVTTIGDYTFYYCYNLKNVTIPNGVTGIGDSAFCECNNLTDVAIPDSVTSIGPRAFNWCSQLAHVTIGKGVTHIGDFAFTYTGLADVTVDAANPAYSSDENGALYNKDKTVLIQYPRGSARTAFTIPDSVTSIGDYAFSDCSNLESVTIPDSVTSIGENAFSDCCNLESVTIPDSVTSIDGSAFSWCTKLAHVTIGKGVTHIGDFAFANTGLADVTVDAANPAYSSDENGVLYNKDKTELVQYPCGSACTAFTIPDSVTSIGNAAFYNCDNLESVTIPDGVTRIGDYAFNECYGITSVVLPSSVTVVGHYTFAHCSNLVLVHIPASVTSIGSSILEENDTYICADTADCFAKTYAGQNGIEFRVCEGHDSATCTHTYTSKVTTEPYCTRDGVCVYVCSRCGSTYSETIPALGHDYEVTVTEPTCTERGFSEYRCSRCGEGYGNSISPLGHDYVGAVIKAPTSTEAGEMQYTCTRCGDSYTGSIAPYNVLSYTIADGAVTITGCERSFGGALVIPESIEGRPVTGIGDYAFSNCSNLTSVTIPDGVTTIGDYTFYYCYNLASVTIPDGVTSIGDYAFSNCSNLASVTIPDGVTSIGDGAFYDCYRLASVTIPDSVTSIGDWAFAYCNNLASVTIPDGVTSLGESAFQSCSRLTSVTIPRSVTNIGEGAFAYCWNLASVNVDEENPAYSSDADGVLYNKTKTELIQCPCRNPRPVFTIPDGVKKVDAVAFYNCNNLTSVTIPDSVTEIGDSAFDACGNLASITVDGNNPAYSSDDCGVLYNKEKTVLIRYPCGNPRTVFTIPDSVTSVGARAFNNCNRLASVTIPDSVTGIGEWAFAYCDNLVHVSIGNGVTVIGEWAFEGCRSLTDVTIPGSVICIGDYAFEDCVNLVRVTISEGVTRIGRGAFRGCTCLASVTIGFGVVSIGDYAFERCANLAHVTLPNSVCRIEYGAFRLHFETDQLAQMQQEYDAALAQGETRVNDMPLDVVKNILDHPQGCLADVVFLGTQEEWDAVDVDTDNDDLLNAPIRFSEDETPCEHDYAAAVTKEPTCTDDGVCIYTCALCGRRYAEIIPALGHNYAATVTKAPSVTEPGEMLCACTRCGDSNPKSIAPYNVLSYSIVDGEVSITGCNLSEVGAVIIPDTIEDYPVTGVGDYAFRYCSNLAYVTIPDGVTRIGNEAFYGCYSLAGVTIPDSVTSIGNRAFEDCWNLHSITIPDGVTSIGNEAFCNCDRLVNVTIPKSATRIGDRVFLACDRLAKITADKDNPAFGSDEYGVLYNKDKTVLIQYPCGNPRASFEIPDSVTEIGPYAFENCRKLARITIPDGVTSLGENAFQSCSRLTSVTIPRSVTNIGAYAFESCAKLARITISDGVTSIGDYAFSDCSKLESVTIPDSVTEIGQGAFRYCTSLASITVDENNPAYSSDEYGVLYNKDKTELIQYPCGDPRTAFTIPDGVTRIGDWAFCGCASLANITIPDGVTYIGSDAFSGCTSLADVTIPDGVTYIGSDAFSGCTSLADVTIPDGVTHIESYTFYGCTSLAHVQIPRSVTYIGYEAFRGCSSLKSVHIPFSVTTIDGNVFSDTALEYICSNTAESYAKTYAESIGVEFRTCDGHGEPPCVHTYESVFTTEPTCTEDGERVCTCTRCGDRYTETVSALGHAYDVSVTKAPTCTEDGERVYTCRRCGDSYTQTAAALGHAYRAVITKEPTLTEEGERTYTCSRCGDTYTRSIPKTIEGTYGVLEYRIYDSEVTITRCDQGASGSVGIPNAIEGYPVKYIGRYAFYGCEDITSVTIPNSVTSIGDNAFDACVSLARVTIPGSVTSIGDQAFLGCKNLISIHIPSGVTQIGSSVFFGCDHLEYICSDAADCRAASYAAGIGVEFRICDGHDSATCKHTYVDAVTTEPTCAKEGVRTFTCSRCGDQYTETIPALGHEWDEGRITTEPTCTKKGVRTFTCSRCSGTKTESVDALGHDFSEEWTVDVQPTCTEDGVKSRHCSRCDARADETVIEALGHAWDEGTVTTEPTCTKEGVRTFTCSRCDGTKTESVDALGHDFSEEWTVDVQPTCTEDGVKSRHCSRCDAVTDETVIEALGHDYAAVVTDPTCTQDGFTTYTCTRCGESYTDDVVPAPGHEWDGAVTDPTCTQDGFTTYICTRCGETYTDDVVPAPGHDFSEEWTVDVQPTCTEDGVKSHHCSRCDAVTDETVIDALGHEWDEGRVTTEPTCTKEGVRTFTCSRCGGTKTESVDALGHEFSEEWTVDMQPTCTEDGVKSRHCTRCDARADETVIDALGHEWDGAVTDPTCTQDGFTTYTCTRCGETYTDDVVPAPGHDFSEEWTVDVQPTCTEDGSKSRHCSRCDAVTDETVIDALGHDWDAAVIAPTCTQDGFTTYTCTRCGKTYTDDVVLAPGHDMGAFVTVYPATCTQAGLERSDCSRCSYYETREIKAAGHRFGDWIVDTPATPYRSGTKHRVCSVCGFVETQIIEKLPIGDIDPAKYGIATFYVVDAFTNAPIANAHIRITVDGDEYVFDTDQNGYVRQAVPIGLLTFSVFADGYLVRNLQYEIQAGEQTVPTIGLSQKPMVDAQITTKPMTKEEIIAAGIDVDDPDNSHIFKYEVDLQFEAELETYTFSFDFLWDEDNKIEVGKKDDDDPDPDPDPVIPPCPFPDVGGTDDIGWGPGRKIELPNGVPVVVYSSERFFLIVYGEVKWLKEMFDVEMLVVNNSLTDTAEDCVAELVLPDGLSLAGMVGEEQTARHTFGNIESGTTASHHWFVRGDKAGTYDVSAFLTGTMKPHGMTVGESFTYGYVAQDPITVYAGDALHMNIIIPDAAYSYDLFKYFDLEDYDEVYPITLELENVSDMPIYGLSHKITGLTQFVVRSFDIYTRKGNQPVDVLHEYTTNWCTDGLVFAVDELLPGEKLVVKIETTIRFYSHLQFVKDAAGVLDKLLSILDHVGVISAAADPTGIILALTIVSKILSEMDIRYCLRDFCVHELEGSTTTIPTTFTIQHIEHPSIFLKLASFLIDELLEKLGTDVLNAMGMSEAQKLMTIATVIGAGTAIDIASASAKPDTRITAWIEKGDDRYEIQGKMMNNWCAGPNIDLQQLLVNLGRKRMRSKNAGTGDDLSEKGKLRLAVAAVESIEAQEKEILNRTALTAEDYADLYALAEEKMDRYAVICDFWKTITALDADAQEKAEYIDAYYASRQADYQLYVQGLQMLENGTGSSSDLFGDTFTLSCSNPDTQLIDGKLVYTGKGDLHVAANNAFGTGTLCVDLGDGEEIVRIPLQATQAHECAGEWETLYDPTSEYCGFRVKNCAVCGKLIDLAFPDADAPTLDKIEVQDAGTGSDYALHDAFDLSKITLLATFSDGSTQTITEGFTADTESFEKPGVQTVRISYQNEECEYTVRVLEPVKKIELVPLSTTIGLTDSPKLSVDVYPSFAQTPQLVWSSSDKNVLTVSQDGIVTAGKRGSAEVTVSTADGSCTSTITVTVVPRSFTVTWLVDETKTEMTVDEADTIPTPEDPVKEGYTFKGWTPEVPATMPASDRTFTAVFEANTYTVTWIADGKSTVDTLTFGSAIVKPADPVKEGYTFKGWTPEVPATMPAGDRTFTAVFEANTYTVTWIADGKSTVDTLTFGSAIVKPADPVKEGYTFKGWTPEVPATMPASDLTFTAAFEVNTYTVTWIADGKTTVETLTFGSAIVKPADPVKEGRTFKGWTPEVPATMPASDMTFTAVFDPITVTSVRIAKMPAKTVYTYRNDKNVDLSGMELEVTYSDKTKKTVTDTSACKVSGYSAKPSGEKTITVEYEGQTAQFKVTVEYLWWQRLIMILLFGWLWY